MAFISTINGSTRKVYLDSSAAVGGVLTFHPVSDIYAEYKSLRASNESIRPFSAFMSAEGNIPKGGGKFTPRYLLLLEGTKLVIPDGVQRVEVTGEVLTDNQTDPFDYSLISGACTVNYKPAEAEVIKVTASGNEYSLQEIALEVWNILKSTAFAENSMGEHVKSLGNSASNTSFYELATSIVRTVGSDQGGTITNILSHDDNMHSTGEIVGAGLEVLVNFNDADLRNPQKCSIVGRYAGSTGHTIYIQAYNYTSSIFETRGVMLNRTTTFDYSIPLSDDNISGTGDMQIRFLHSPGTYLSSHRLYIDFIQIELIDTSSTLIADINSIKSKTDQMEFVLGRINANAQMISDSTAVADAVETNINNLDTKVSAVKKLVLAGL